MFATACGLGALALAPWPATNKTALTPFKIYTMMMRQSHRLLRAAGRALVCAEASADCGATHLVSLAPAATAQAASCRTAAAENHTQYSSRWYSSASHASATADDAPGAGAGGSAEGADAFEAELLDAALAHVVSARAPLAPTTMRQLRASS